MTDITIASVMICGLPRYVKGRLILSGYDGVWEAVEELPDDIKPYLTDDIGNEIVSYGGFLQIINPDIFGLLDNHDLFTCFRGIQEEYVERVQAYPPREVYKNIATDLRLMGWDLSTGNGWRSASCDGYFPLDPFTGEYADNNHNYINEYGLIIDKEHCIEYSKLNNEKVTDHAPWFPVAIYVDSDSYKRLLNYSDKKRLEMP